MTAPEYIFNLVKKPWFISLYFLIVICSYFFVDKHIATYFYQLNLRTTVHWLNIFTGLGQWMVYFPLLVLAGVYFHFIKKNAVHGQKALYLIGCLVVPNVVALILKVCLGRARPDLLFSDQLYGFYGFEFKSLYWSCPSGHSITIAAMAAGLGVLIPKYFYAFLIVAVMVALSRVVLYQHYLSDVLVGFFISLLTVGIYTHIFQKKVK